MLDVVVPGADATLSHAEGNLLAKLVEVYAAKEGTLSHFGQEQVTESLAGARRKAIGDAGGWKWDRKSLNVDLTPVMAVTNAHYGVVKFGAAKVRPEAGKVVML